MSRMSQKCALKINRLATIDMDQKVGAVVLLSVGRGSWDTIQHNIAWAEAYLRTKRHLDPSNRLATIHQHLRQDRETTGRYLVRTGLQTVAPKRNCYSCVALAVHSLAVGLY